MQTAVQVICRPGTSLRQKIAADVDRPDSKFEKVTEKNPGRNPGWLKIKSKDPAVWGALNVTWDAATQTLACRVINRRLGTPHRVLGQFVEFLMQRYPKRVKAITIFPV